MKEHPILFSSPMVRAILEGRKTMTRRVIDIRKYHGFDAPRGAVDVEAGYPFVENQDGDFISLKTLCPYGQPGDRLWVRETWRPICHAQRTNESYVRYRADEGLKPVEHNMKMDIPFKWKPSIHMPRWVSRLTLEVVSVRVERLQDISKEDAKSEGCGESLGDQFGINYIHGYDTLIKLFSMLWDSINLKRGYGWDSNPWVWVIEFKRV